MFEAQAANTPAVVVAQNPRELTHRHLGWEHGVISLGMGRMVTPHTFQEAVHEALRPTTWVELQKATQGHVDAFGAQRIARRIEALALKEEP